MRSRNLNYWIRSTLVAAAVCNVTPALGQETGDLGEVVVTGSRIARPSLDTVSPVVTITAAEMSARGQNSVFDALRDLAQNSGGFIDQQDGFGFTPSANAVDLRGFGVGRSLVLLDGRRLPTFPVAADGTDNFVDLASIPLGAIERVEVLTDGASAVYGSDAISGVVNIVLKKKTEDQVTVRYSDTTHGGGANTRVQLASGFDTPGDGSLLVFGEFMHQQVLEYSDRSRTASDRLGGVNGPGPGGFSGYGDPGTFFSFLDNGDVVPVAAANCSTANGNPGTVNGICRFNRAAYRQLMPDIDQYSLAAKFETPLSDHVELFSRAMWTRNRTRLSIEPMAFDQFDDVGLLVGADSASNPTNPLIDTGGVYAGTNGPGFFRRRMVEFGPREEDTKTNSINVMAGLRGDIGTYHWEFAVQRAQQRIKTINSGYVLKSAIGALLAGPDADGDGIGDGGSLNLFDTIPQSVVDQLMYHPRTDGKSSVTSADFQFSGDLIETWAGMSQFAFYTEFARQSYSDKRDQAQLDGDIVALGGTAGGGSRKYYAAGVEVQVPLASMLNANLAGRYDQYDDASDVGGAFSPRIALEFRPFESLLIRGTWGKSFRAPDLQRLFGAETTGFEDVIDTPQCIADGGTGRGDENVASCVNAAESIETRTGSNRKLKEEKGTNISFGVVFSPVENLQLSIDVFQIKLKNIVNTPDIQLILDKNAADGSFADAIVRNPLLVSSQNPGGIETISAVARNLSFQKTNGIDVAIDYGVDSSVGHWSFGASATYTNKLDVREAPGEEVIDVLAQGILIEAPRFRGSVNVGWDRGPIGISAYVKHIGKITPLETSFYEKINSWTTLNLSGHYDTPWKGRISVGVNNVFDREAPLDLQGGTVAPQPFYNQYFHDMTRRSIVVSYTHKF